jgi:hypothetical protein
MIWLLAGAAALLLLLLLGTAFASAPVRRVKQALVVTGALLCLLVLGGLLLSGRGGLALGVLLPLFALGRSAWRGWRTARQFGQPAPDSGVETATLSMRLDLASGVMSGTVRRGRFAGADLAGLDRMQLLALLEDCRREDSESLPLLEAWLDRVHPGWQAQAGSAEAMDRAEALAVLGLAEGATAEEIRAAHRRLMRSAHPDHGGSDGQAARLNRAREVLERAAG